MPTAPPAIQRIFPTMCGSGKYGARPRVRQRKRSIFQSRSMFLGKDRDLGGAKRWCWSLAWHMLFLKEKHHVFADLVEYVGQWSGCCSARKEKPLHCTVMEHVRSGITLFITLLRIIWSAVFGVANERCVYGGQHYFSTTLGLYSEKYCNPIPLRMLRSYAVYVPFTTTIIAGPVIEA